VRTIAIIYGGFSGERVISERSAQVSKQNIDSKNYRSFLVDISREGWFCHIEDEIIPIDKNDFTVTFKGEKVSFDAVFCAIHGTPGEDGKIQGYFDSIGIPYNNCGVLASALTFDKAACNRYLSASGVKVAKSYLARLGTENDPKAIIDRVGLPCFVKPNDGGSSIGVTKVKEASQLMDAIEHAQSEGVDALIESLLVGVEVSCGCMKIQGQSKSLGITEIVPGNEFFDFESKYNHAGTKEITPARIESGLYTEVENLTEQIYEWLHCKGMIRVDYMICDNGIYLIEVNTTPGLSEASIIPAQAKNAGYSLEQFFQLAVDEMFR